MILLFDLNGTLLDMRALKPHFRKIFKGKLTGREWFTEVLQYAASISLAGDYKPLPEIASAVLRMKAEALGVSLSESAVQQIQQQMKTLPPYPEVKRALDSLKKANIRMAVLTNSAPETMHEQIGGLGSYFEQTLSVDQVRRYKPAIDTYQFAMRALGTSPDETVMVAAHPWDLMGAQRAGFRTAFIRRPGRALFPGAPTPTYVAKDIADLASQLGAKSGVQTAGTAATVITTAVLAGVYLSIRQRR